MAKRRSFVLDAKLPVSYMSSKQNFRNINMVSDLIGATQKKRATSVVNVSVDGRKAV